MDNDLKKQEDEQIAEEKEILAEKEDDEALRRAREFDEFRDGELYFERMHLRCILFVNIYV